MDGNRFPLAVCRRLEPALGHRPVLAEIGCVSFDPVVLPLGAGRDRRAGLMPGATTPVWPMADPRDRFLTAFSSSATASRGDPR
jgi:hypothetical protein